MKMVGKIIDFFCKIDESVQKVKIFTQGGQWIFTKKYKIFIPIMDRLSQQFF